MNSKIAQLLLRNLSGERWEHDYLNIMLPLMNCLHFGSDLSDEPSLTPHPPTTYPIF